MPKTMTIAGGQYEVPDAESLGYTEGHVCTAAEARSLFQTRCENIGNNLRKQVEEWIKAGEDVNAKVADYANTYTFATPGVGGTRRVMDPVEREARTMAVRALKSNDKIMKGRKVKDIDVDAWENAIQAVITKNDLLAKAKKIVAARQKAGAEDLEGIDLAAA